MNSVIDLAMITSAIVSLGVEKIVDEAKHLESVIKLLRQFGWADNPPVDFDGVYAYTLVEYGVGKPRFILEFFRDPIIVKAFRKSFEERKISILDVETESFLEWSEIGKELKEKDVDPRTEFDHFRRVFGEIIDRTRMPKEIRSEHKIDDIHRAVFTLLSDQTRPSQYRKTEDKKCIDLDLYARKILERYQEWLGKYTSLLADEREIETYVVFTDEQLAKSNTGIPIVNLPHQYHLAIVLGESGAGKTTALWKIMIDNCSRLRQQSSNVLPILINMRDWSFNTSCRDLVAHQFIGVNETIVEETLEEGNCVILIDSINEIPFDNNRRKDAKRDLISFLRNYQKNRFVLCCRTSDFDNTLDLDTVKEYFPNVKLFEIRRLTREQVTEYINRYFIDDESAAIELISRLAINNDFAWNNSSSYVHLARIPLYLKLIISEYKQHQSLPSNKSELIRSLIQNVFAREKQKSMTMLDDISKESILSALAYKSNLKGFYLKIPSLAVHEILKTEVSRLRRAGVLNKAVTVNEAWSEIVSNNFLRVTNFEWAEWLHQLIFDYFLAQEIVRILTRNNKAEMIQIIRNIDNKQWQQPYEIAVGLLSPRQGAELLNKILEVDRKLAQIVFENQRQDDKEKIAEEITRLVVYGEEADSQKLSRLILSLPSLSIVEALGQIYKSGHEKIRVMIAFAVSKLVRSLLPIVISGRPINIVESQYRRTFREFEVPAVNRGLQLLRAWVNSRNEEVKFYSAKGLWETDKGEASIAFRSLLNGRNQKVLSQVKDLVEKWGIT